MVVIIKAHNRLLITLLRILTPLLLWINMGLKLYIISPFQPLWGFLGHIPEHSEGAQRTNPPTEFRFSYSQLP